MEKQECDPQYEDILHRLRPENPRRCRMTRHDRAAQFAPFAALTGFDAAIAETARLTDQRIELTEGRRAELNEILCKLMKQLDRQPRVTLTHFVYDPRKAGGAYLLTTGNIKKIDPLDGLIFLTNGAAVEIEETIDIEAEGI